MSLNIEENEIKELPRITEVFKGQSIFITGGTGFMGKVLIEKLLYSCPDIENIYLLLRPKRNKCAETRIAEMFKIPLFQRIREECPNAQSKVKAISGNLEADYLGLSDEDRDFIQKECSIIFHTAATLNMNAPLKEALTQNTLATAHITDLAKGMKKLTAYVHLSTAYCHMDHEVLEEKIYDPPVDYEEILKAVKWLSDEAVDSMTEKLIYPHPNTYTYTKRLAECIVNKASETIPAVIVRPSIVMPVWKEPVPGWVDNLNGPIGLSAGAGKGLIRTMMCDPKCHVDLISVDIAINAMIIAAWRRVCDTSKNIQVYNVSIDIPDRITYEKYIQIGKETVEEYPFENTIWYPDGAIRTNPFTHKLCILFYHLLPALFIDFLCFIFGRKPFMWSIQQKVSKALVVLQYFTSREWRFKTENFKNLKHLITEKENKIFYTDTPTDDEMKSVFTAAVLGVRKFVFKEDPSSLPECRRRLRRLYWIRQIIWGVIYAYMLYCCYTLFDNSLTRFKPDSSIILNKNNKVLM